MVNFHPAGTIVLLANGIYFWKDKVMMITRYREATGDEILTKLVTAAQQTVADLAEDENPLRRGDPVVEGLYVLADIPTVVNPLALKDTKVMAEFRRCLPVDQYGGESMIRISVGDLLEEGYQRILQLGAVMSPNFEDYLDESLVVRLSTSANLKLEPKSKILELLTEDGVVISRKVTYSLIKSLTAREVVEVVKSIYDGASEPESVSQLAIADERALNKAVVITLDNYLEGLFYEDEDRGEAVKGRN